MHATGVRKVEYVSPASGQGSIGAQHQYSQACEALSWNKETELILQHGSARQNVLASSFAGELEDKKKLTL